MSIERSNESIGNELAVLCRMSSLAGDFPATAGSSDEVESLLTSLIDQILDADMAVDPIEHAVDVLTRDGHIDGLSNLASEMLRRRNDQGDWGAILKRLPRAA